ncbi:hypothetical protein [Glaciibacter superstes]|uniref:hypothetical protein n=1 Tax=Glaciibacter superstes TaxID=501023 RepID=UPI0003B66684|nr:hypothetical protein [Glaciibacter superstes]
MDGAGTRGFDAGFDSAFDGAAQRAAERLAALREQRMRLAAVRDEVDASLMRHRSAAIDPAWRSDAQRAYSSKRDDLTRRLSRAQRLLDDALDAVHREIAGLAAGS